MQRALQVTLVVLGLVATVFGGVGVIGGVPSIPGTPPPDPSVDSEFRFYAAWYVFAGIVLFHVARRPDSQAEATLLRWLCAALALGATGRVISWVAIGRPATVFVVLMVVEYVIAGALPPWQWAIRRRRAPGDQR